MAITHRLLVELRFTKLLGILKLYAPYMPHLTEVLYQAYFVAYEEAISIHLTSGLPLVKWMRLYLRLVKKSRKRLLMQGAISPKTSYP